MSLAKILACSVMALTAGGCDSLFNSHPKEIRKVVAGAACDGLDPLTADEIEAWQLPAPLLDMLPHGRKTPVSLIGDAADTRRATGIAFPVGAAVAPLTVHALRRELSRLESETKPVVVFLSMARQEQVCVEVLLRFPSEKAVLDLSGHASSSLLNLLDRWRPTTGASILGVGDGWAQVEVERLPADADSTEQFVQELVALSDSNEADVARVRSGLQGDRRVHIAY